MASSSNSSRNPTGKNQHTECPKTNDERVNDLLQRYQRSNITNRVTISRLLKAEGLVMSEATVARRRKALNLLGSRSATRNTSDLVKRQLVLDQLAKDPNGRKGPRLIRESIAFDTGISLTRDFITDEMRTQEPEGFAIREPTASKKTRTFLVSLGPHHEWSADGHDKLSDIGFPIWAVRDKWSGKWLGMWVVPNNRLKRAIAYLYLSLVKRLGGMPIQSTTDCGSETIHMFALANALREYFSPHLDREQLVAHMFLKSVHNITIEKGWLRLRLQWGDNVKIFWDAGSDIYNSTNHHHYELVQWLWPKLVQQEIDELQERLNSHPTRLDRKKQLPSGVSPNVAFTLYQEYDAENCLQPVDVEVVQKMMDDIGGEELIRFVSVEYAARAQGIFESLNVSKLAFDNVWEVFSTMLPYLSD